MYSSVLVANRGEIALRIISTLQDHGIESVLTCSDLDLNSVPAKKSDRILHLPGKSSQETYLDIDQIIGKAKEMGIQAIHPGYGFLAENSQFASAALDAKIDFIGPTPHQMKIFGDKIEARKLAVEANTPIIQGTPDDLSVEELKSYANEIGYPLLIKASAGGGGRGIRLVTKEEDFSNQFELAKSEAKMAFNDDRVYIEKFISEGKHIEVQVLGDGTGKVLHFGERDCSMQRKNQKLIEESPAPSISRERAERIHETAVNLASHSNYKNAGTVEFLVDKENHYFLEVNARIQVEHPVTEMVTGEDLIWRQLQVAADVDLDLSQKDIKFRGHAIEARIYAEDPYSNFRPSTGRINQIKHPIGLGIRVDTAVDNADVISPFYDPMISKLIVHSPNRQYAVNKMVNALKKYLITGIHTTIPYIVNLLQTEEFNNLQYHTRFLEKYKVSIPEEILLYARIAAAGIRKNNVKSVESRDIISPWKISARINR